ncbi:topless-related protein 4 [Tanacetum coccineum]|uniref:Topless-related protein 4 n=1 Tax=Tanacetum coccineum TaxID=301880 RepID=A0ABQ5BVJ7_9ASTR
MVNYKRILETNWLQKQPVQQRMCIKIEAHIGNVNDLAFLNQDHRLYIITCGQDTTVKIWAAVTGVKLRTFEGHDAPVYSVCVHLYCQC